MSRVWSKNRKRNRVAQRILPVIVISSMLIYLLMNQIRLTLRKHQNSPKYISTEARFHQLLCGCNKTDSDVTGADDSIVSRHLAALTDPSFIDKLAAEKIISSEQLSTVWKKINMDFRPIVFVKTHKTGSSTIQSLFYRYALLRNLTVALPVHTSSFIYPVLKFHRSMVLPQLEVQKHDMVLHSMIFNPSEVNKIVKDRAVYITILRRPADVFISAFKFYKHSKCFDGSQLASLNFTQYRSLNISKCEQTDTQVANTQLFDLGISLETLTGKNRINNAIQWLESKLHLVLIAERFEESLLVLKRELGWTMDDIIYFVQNRQIKIYNKSNPHKTVEKITIKMWNSITEFNYADYLLYHHFKVKFNAKLNELYPKQRDLTHDILELREKQNELYWTCVEGMVPPQRMLVKSVLHMFVGYGNSYSYLLRKDKIDDPMCRLLALPERSFDKLFKGRANYSECVLMRQRQALFYVWRREQDQQNTLKLPRI